MSAVHTVSFFHAYVLQGLQKICKKHGIGYILDEVQTGGGPAGVLWAHELFDLVSTGLTATALLAHFYSTFVKNVLTFQ